MQNINAVALSGNLTRDPEMKEAGELTICNMRVACNGRARRDGEWQDKPNFFNVVVFGALAENCGKYLAKGRGIMVSGRLDWREWDAPDGGGHREAVQVIGENIQFLPDGKSDGGGSSAGSAPQAAVSSTPVDDEDIPF